MDAVTSYIEEAPEEQQATLTRLRSLISDCLPTTTEEIGSSRFPVYTHNGEWVAGFASRKKGPMLYIMKTEVLDANEDRLGDARSGKSCVDFDSSDEMWALAEAMLGQTRSRIS